MLSHLGGQIKEFHGSKFGYTHAHVYS